MELKFDEVFGKMRVGTNDYKIAIFILGKFIKEVFRSALKLSDQYYSLFTLRGTFIE